MNERLITWNDYEELLADHPECNDPKAMAATLRRKYKWPVDITGKYAIDRCTNKRAVMDGESLHVSPSKFVSPEEAKAIWRASPFRGRLSKLLIEAIERRRAEGYEAPEPLEASKSIKRDRMRRGSCA